MTHVVGPGETIASIARRYSVSADALARANRTKLRRWQTPKRGGPSVRSDKRTLPLVAAPAQTTWIDKKGTSRTANASPHTAGRAMDVGAPDRRAGVRLERDREVLARLAGSRRTRAKCHPGTAHASAAALPPV
ncbi:MAG TPA: LysM domain-containing protein [Solirubrobacter sp.]